MIFYFFVAVGDDDHCLRSMNSATKELNEIECAFVSPVNIFDNYYRQPALTVYFIENSRENRTTRRSFLEESQQFAVCLLSYIVEGAKGPRRKQIVTGTPQYAFLFLGKAFDQRGLSDPSFTANEHKSSFARSHIIPYGLQVVQELVAFEKFHHLY